jgi:hypothetical protein
MASALETAASPAPAPYMAPNTEQCFTATGDAYIDSANPSTNYGDSRELEIAALSNSTDESHIYAAFDLSNIPTNATIVTATLSMELLSSDFREVPSILAAAESPWDEANITWNTSPGSIGGYDTPVHSDALGVKTWDATQLVKDWHSGQIPNYGLALLPNSTADVLAAFASRENVDGQPPTLCVFYDEPTPTPTNTPSPTPSRTPLPTWTPIPTETPTRGPTPTATPPVYALAYQAPVFSGSYTLPDPDLSIHGIEITQGIQCFDSSNGLSGCGDNSLPVIARKNSAARIYLKYGGLVGSASNIPVRLYIRPNGGFWYTAYTTGKAASTLDQSANDDARVYFNVNFTNDVAVDFYAVVDPDDTISESDETNNRFPAGAGNYITLNFQKRDSMKIVGQRLRYHPPGYSGSQYAGGWAVNGGAANWFEQMLPIRTNGINYQIKSGYLDWTTSLSSGSGQHALIEHLNQQWILHNAFAWFFGANQFTGADHVYGWAPNDGYSGGHADMPVYPHAGGLGVVGIGTDRPGTSTDNPGGGALILGHELVHDYDIFHTNTGGDDCGSNDGSSNFPYSTSSIQEFGFNPITGQIYDPADTHDLMSYCPAGGSKQGWIAPFTWNQMFNNLQNTVSKTAYQPENTADIPYRLRTTAEDQALVVHATIFNPDHEDYAGTPGALGDLHRIDGNIAYTLPDGNYAVELRDGDGNTLHREDFAVSFESEYDAHGGVPHADEPPFPPDPTLRADLSFIVPWMAGTDSVVLLEGNMVLEQRPLSATAPEVTITDPVEAVTWEAGSTPTLSWTGTDADGDPLSYTVLYSSNAGADWQIMATGYPSTTLEIDVDALAGTNDGRFRVVATDGINTGYDESPAPIEIANKPPIPTIMEPQARHFVHPGDLVVLAGSATDLEDGTLDETALEWSSDVQGNLGKGASLPLNTLERGPHIITLTARDSYGVTASESVEIFVGYPVYLPLISNR